MSRLPVSGLPSSTTDQSSAAEAAHIQPSNTQANGILEQIWAVNGLENKLFKKTKSKKVMAIFVDSSITQHCLFWNGEKNHITTYVSDYTKFQDVAYTVDAVVLYVSVAVELWDFHQGTSVQNDQTHHSQSPENMLS